MFKKLLALLLSVSCLLAVTACGGGGPSIGLETSSEELDETKTYLNIGNYNGGLGYAWLREVADNYQAQNPDVIVKINNDKDGLQENVLTEKIEELNRMVGGVHGMRVGTVNNRLLA